jgi:hypothetical protein
MDPYFSTKARGAQKGMGLGLSTVFSIVKKHNGFMFLESEKSAGTTVSIYLPASPQMETEIKAALEPSSVDGAGVPLKGYQGVVDGRREDVEGDGSEDAPTVRL